MSEHEPQETAREKHERKHREAEERKAQRAKRSPQGQLAVLRSRGITSGREWDRLLKKINPMGGGK